MGRGYKSGATKQSDQLLEAIRKGDAAGVKEWLENGASPSGTGSGDLTPLAVAARLNQTECAEALVSALEQQGPGSPRLREGFCSYPPVLGSPQNGKGVSALQEAARSGSLECVRLLAGRGWDIEERGPEGRTALSWACARRRLDVARELLALGANARGLGEDLIDVCNGGRVDFAELLLSAGCPADSRSRHGETALMAAAVSDNVKLAELLIQHGASVEAVSDQGMTALHTAGSCNAADVAALLMREGASALSPNKHGQTPLDASRPEDEENSGDSDDDETASTRGALNAAGRVMEVFMERQTIAEAANVSDFAGTKAPRL